MPRDVELIEPDVRCVELKHIEGVASDFIRRSEDPIEVNLLKDAGCGRRLSWSFAAASRSERSFWCAFERDA